MYLSLSLQQDFQTPELILDESEINHILTTALQYLDMQSDYEIGIACVDKEYSQQLNHQYRNKDKPTNVLSFSSELPEEIANTLDSYPLGDLVICIPVVLAEATHQHKTPSQHFSHLLVHGLLHLLGYDHETSPEDAEEMEQLEIEILAKLNIANPYQDDEI